MAKETLRNVRLEVDHPVGMRIGQKITGDIKDVWLERTGTAVGPGAKITEVAAGTKFVVAVRFNASNPGFPHSVTDFFWSIGLTAMSTDGKVHAKEWAQIARKPAGPGDTIVGEIDRIGGAVGQTMTMPDHDITLRIKLWGNQEAGYLGFAPPLGDW